MRKIITTAGVCFLISAALKILSFFEFEHREIIYTFSSVLLFVLSVLFLKLISPRVGMRKFLKLRFIKNGDGKILFYTTLLVISGGFLINLLTLTVLDIFGATVPSNSFTSFNSENIWLSVLTVAVVPAIFEELFFRGAVMSAVSAEKNITAILISSLFFAAVHGSFYYFFSNFYAGVIFSLMIYVTGSLYVSILAHFFNNILSYALFVYSNRMTTIGFDAAVFWILLLFFLLSLYGSIGVIAKKFKQQLQNERPILNEGEILWEKRKQKKSREKL